MNDGWGAFLIILIIWAACMYMEWHDRKHGVDRW